MQPGLSSRFPEALTEVLQGRHLSGELMRAVMAEIMTGARGEAEVAGLLVALRLKGETAEEIAAAASVLREHMVRLETGRDDLLDTCGTGGDERGTLNISTAAALVVAGAGVPVVKHGNRAVSSRSGSADVLTSLGVAVEGDGRAAQHCLDGAGLAFCFAPHFHPAMSRVAPVRRQLRARTLFNCLGPLANPAGAPCQLIGVGRAEWLDPLAGAVARLGTRCTFLVHGRDGLDEVSLAAPTLVREVRGHTVLAREWTADDFGLEGCRLEDLLVSGPEQSASLIRGILEGRQVPATRTVLANAAAALVAVGRVRTLREGVACATEAVAAGRARRALERLASCSHGA